VVAARVLVSQERGEKIAVVKPRQIIAAMSDAPLIAASATLPCRSNSV
jgi:hypothetical protein